MSRLNGEERGGGGQDGTAESSDIMGKRNGEPIRSAENGTMGRGGGEVARTERRLERNGIRTGVRNGGQNGAWNGTMGRVDGHNGTKNGTQGEFRKERGTDRRTVRNGEWNGTGVQMGGRNWVPGRNEGQNGCAVPNPIALTGRWPTPWSP